MKDKSARDIAETGLDKFIEGDTETGEKLIDKAKQINPKAVEELAEEVERDKENAKRVVNKGLPGRFAASALAHLLLTARARPHDRSCGSATRDPNMVLNHGREA